MLVFPTKFALNSYISKTRGTIAIYFQCNKAKRKQDIKLVYPKACLYQPFHRRLILLRTVSSFCTKFLFFKLKIIKMNSLYTIQIYITQFSHHICAKATVFFNINTTTDKHIIFLFIYLIKSYIYNKS